jgi:hypothetical protein
MSLSMETITKINPSDLEQAAEITALGFGREFDDENYRDTQAHLESADQLQIVRDEERLVAFAAYRNLLWQPCS